MNMNNEKRNRNQSERDDTMGAQENLETGQIRDQQEDTDSQSRDES